jgi:hypothetical protein
LQKIYEDIGKDDNGYDTAAINAFGELDAVSAFGSYPHFQMLSQAKIPEEQDVDSEQEKMSEEEVEERQHGKVCNISFTVYLQLICTEFLTMYFAESRSQVACFR